MPRTSESEGARFLTGKSDDAIVIYPHGNVGVHLQSVGALDKLRAAAKAAGFDLQLCSGFRGFDAQLKIWNEKALGKRPILDEKSKPIELKGVSTERLLHAILRWSALPGMSRHHWGTDYDVYDLSRMPKDYRLRLVPEEFQEGGYFKDLHDWLDTNMHQYGFFRPYGTDRGGVSPERWHLSYAPLSQKYWEQLTPELVGKALSTAQIELEEVIRDHLEDIFERYFRQIDLPG